MATTAFRRLIRAHPGGKAKPIRVDGVEVPAARVQIVLDELCRPESFTPERTAHAVALVCDLLTTGDAKSASIEQVAALRQQAAPGTPKLLHRSVQPVINVGPAPGGYHTFETSHRVNGRDAELVRVITWLQSVRASDFTSWKAMRGPLIEQIARLEDEARSMVEMPHD
jgi:hypothetical protein